VDDDGGGWEVNGRKGEKGSGFEFERSETDVSADCLNWPTISTRNEKYSTNRLKG
jgi:hypothetical protein